MFIVTCFFAQPDCIKSLPELCNTIIKRHLCGEGLPFLLPFFSKEAGYIAANHPMPIKQAKRSLYQAL